jgi:hypothetical protein
MAIHGLRHPEEATLIQITAASALDIQSAKKDWLKHRILFKNAADITGYASLISWT